MCVKGMGSHSWGFSFKGRGFSFISWWIIQRIIHKGESVMICVGEVVGR